MHFVESRNASMSVGGVVGGETPLLNPLLTPKSDDECWICMDNAPSLVSLQCHCRRVVHLACARRWYGARAAARDTCETCRGSIVLEWEATDQTAVQAADASATGDENARAAAAATACVGTVLFVLFMVGIGYVQEGHIIGR